MTGEGEAFPVAGLGSFSEDWAGGVATGCVGMTEEGIGTAIGRDGSATTGADVLDENSAKDAGFNPSGMTVVATTGATTASSFLGENRVVEADLNRLGATEGVIGVVIGRDGRALIGLGSLTGNSANEAGGFVKDGNRGAKTELLFVSDDSAEDAEEVASGCDGVAESGFCGLRCSGINTLAVAIVTEVMLPTARRVLDIH